MQRTSSICWNVNLSKLDNPNLIFVLVNLHADSYQQPEYFLLTEAEVKQHFKSVKSGRDYLDYNSALRLDLKDRWEKVGRKNEMAGESEAGQEDEISEIPSMYCDGYCPESALKGEKVRMRLNKDDFYESEATRLQMTVFTGVQAIIMNFRGKGKFRSLPSYADEIINGELLSPQTKQEAFFNDGELFESNMDVKNFINKISAIN